MPNYRSLLERHFKGETFPRDKALRLTLSSVVSEEVGRDKESKPVAYFKEDQRGFIINGTSYSVLADAHKDDATESWEGAVVELYFDPTVTFDGKKIGGVRTRVITPGGKKK